MAAAILSYRALLWFFFYLIYFFVSGEKTQQEENKTLRRNVNNTRWHGCHRIALAMTSCIATAFLSKSSGRPEVNATQTRSCTCDLFGCFPFLSFHIKQMIFVEITTI